jgi:N-acetylmuramic acid 6-phosphate etherase
MGKTNQTSGNEQLDKMSVAELLQAINKEDQTVPLAVEKAIPQMTVLVDKLVQILTQGGRIFYIGAGTSGRLGIVDASECVPTFGIPEGVVVGIMAGGDIALRKAVEFSEDNSTQAWLDLQAYNISSKDFVIGIAASGTTPYVLGALKECAIHNIQTGCIVCNTNSPIAAKVDYPVEVSVGPEILLDSTRMKAGTAQKLALNMISTSVMIRMGKVKGNKMVDMQLKNNKLIKRGMLILVEELGITETKARELLDKFKSVRLALEWHKKNA